MMPMTIRAKKNNIADIQSGDYTHIHDQKITWHSFNMTNATQNNDGIENFILIISLNFYGLHQVPVS